MDYRLTLTAGLRARLQEILFPGDEREAAAIVLCGRQSVRDRCRLLGRQVIPIPQGHIVGRERVAVHWKTSFLVPHLEHARREGLSILKIHSHTVDVPAFSNVDDRADRDLFPSIHAWAGEGPHGSAIMLPTHAVVARIVGPDGRFTPVPAVGCVGDDLEFSLPSTQPNTTEGHVQRLLQTFGTETYRRLRGLKIAAVGCSGTGSLVVEQLARNQVGHLVLVDPKRVKHRNLNRLPQTTMADAVAGAWKVDVLRRAIDAMGFGTRVTCLRTDLFSADAVREVADCDVVFGCMDSIDGRYLLNRLSTFYLVPYFDVGVKLIADGDGGIDQVCGSVHYLTPGGSSLLSRGVITLDQVRAAGLARTDPAEYRRQRTSGYIAGVDEDRPAVMSVNMLFAALAVNEFLARLHPYRVDESLMYAVHGLSLSHGIYRRDDGGGACPIMERYVGRGDVVPLLDMPELSS